jgi:hypothetical protein
MPAGRGVGPPGPGQERAGCAGGPCVGVTLFAIRDLTPMSYDPDVVSIALVGPAAQVYVAYKVGAWAGQARRGY